MFREWLDDEPGAIKPEEARFLEFKTQEEAYLWGVFETIWHDLRAGTGAGLLAVVGDYCRLFGIVSIYEKQGIFEMVKRCLPIVKKDK